MYCVIVSNFFLLGTKNLIPIAKVNDELKVGNKIAVFSKSEDAVKSSEKIRDYIKTSDIQLNKKYKTAQVLKKETLKTTYGINLLLSTSIDLNFKKNKNSKSISMQQIPINKNIYKTFIENASNIYIDKQGLNQNTDKESENNSTTKNTQQITHNTEEKKQLQKKDNNKQEKKTIYGNDSIQILDNKSIRDIINALNELLNAINQFNNELSLSSSTILKCESQLQDEMHYLEFTHLSAFEFFQIARRIKKIRRERRMAKDLLEAALVFEDIITFFKIEKIEDIIKKLEKKNNRSYTIRNPESFYEIKRKQRN